MGKHRNGVCGHVFAQKWLIDVYDMIIKPNCLEFITDAGVDTSLSVLIRTPLGGENQGLRED